MKKPVINLIVDTLAAISLLVMLATGYLLRFPLPPGTNKELVLWGLSRHGWGDVHFWTSALLIAALIIHLVLHWQWIVSMVEKKLGLGTPQPGPHFWGGIATVLSLTIMLVVFALAAHASVKTQKTGADCSPESEQAGLEQVELNETNMPEKINAGMAQKYDSATDLEFWRDIYPVLSSCRSCHSPDIARGGFRIDRKEDYFKIPPLIIPGNALASRLVILLGKRQPGDPYAKLHQLKASDLDLIKRWIDGGAMWQKQ